MTTLKWRRDPRNLDDPDEEIFRARKPSAVGGQYVLHKNGLGQYVISHRHQADNGKITRRLLGTANTLAEAKALTERAAEQQP